MQRRNCQKAACSVRSPPSTQSKPAPPCLAHMTGVSMGSARLPAGPIGIGSLTARCNAEPPLVACSDPLSRSISASLLALSAGSCGTAAAPAAPPLDLPMPLSTRSAALRECTIGLLWMCGIGLLEASARLPSDALLSRRSSGWSSGVGMRSVKSPPSAAGAWARSMDGWARAGEAAQRVPLSTAAGGRQQYFASGAEQKRASCLQLHPPQTLAEAPRARVRPLAGFNQPNTPDAAAGTYAGHGQTCIHGRQAPQRLAQRAPLLAADVQGLLQHFVGHEQQQ